LKRFAEKFAGELLRAAYYDEAEIWNQFPRNEEEMDSGAYWIDDDERFGMRCMLVAEGSAELFEHLYNETRYSDIAWLHHLQAAASYRPDEKKDD